VRAACLQRGHDAIAAAGRGQHADRRAADVLQSRQCQQAFAVHARGTGDLSDARAAQRQRGAGAHGEPRRIGMRVQRS
jgi:hypothetical protein